MISAYGNKNYLKPCFYRAFCMVNYNTRLFIKTIFLTIIIINKKCRLCFTARDGSGGHMRKIRGRVYAIISASDGHDRGSSAYDLFMIAVIAASLVPLIFKETNAVFEAADKVCAGIFIIDYLLRWATADFKYQSFSLVSFIKYPLSPMAIVDLVSILPSLTVINRGFKILRILRMFRALRVFRSFKLFRYSKNAQIIANIFKKQKAPLKAASHKTTNQKF